MNANDHAPAGQSDVLRSAWKRKTELDLQASRLSKQQMQLRKWVAILGVVATILAIVNNQFDTLALYIVPTATFANNHVTNPIWLDYIKQTFHISLIAVPIIISVLAAYTNKFFGGPNWLVMRAGAEEILKELYLYRTVLRNHSERDKWLSRRLTTIQRRTYKSLGGELIIETYDGKLPMYYNPDDPNSDPGFSDLTGDDYMRYRVIDQRDWHRRKIIAIKKERIRIQLYILVMGGIGAFLAAIGGQWAAWVALTAAIASAFTGWEQLRGLDKTITIYSRVILELTIIRDEWEAIAPSYRTEADFVSMVRNAEGVMWAQNQQYVSTMQEAMTPGQGDEAELVESMLQEGDSMTLELQSKMLEEAKGVLHAASAELGKVVEESAATVKGMVSSAAETLSDVGQKVRDTAENEFEEFEDLADSSLARVTIETAAVRTTVTETVDTAMDEVEATREFVSNTTKAAAEEVSAFRETAQETVDTVRTEAAATREALQTTTQKVASETAATRETVQNTVTEQATATREAVDATTAAVSTEVNAARETVQNTVTEQVTETRKMVENTTDEVAAEVINLRETTTKVVETAVSEAGKLRNTAGTVMAKSSELREKLDEELAQKAKNAKQVGAEEASQQANTMASASLDALLGEAQFLIDEATDEMKNKMEDAVVEEIAELITEPKNKKEPKKKKGSPSSQGVG